MAAPNAGYAGRPGNPNGNGGGNPAAKPGGNPTAPNKLPYGGTIVPAVVTVALAIGIKLAAAAAAAVVVAKFGPTCDSFVVAHVAIDPFNAAVTTAEANVAFRTGIWPADAGRAGLGPSGSSLGFFVSGGPASPLTSSDWR